MGIREEEEKLFAELKSADPQIITDGVVDEEEYLAAKPRILYLMKEVNGGSGWDLREFLRDEGGRSHTWNTVARWTEAILALDEEKPWSYWANDHEKRRETMLKKICTVNLKKTSGGGSSRMESICEAAMANSRFLRRQLSLYQADIIVCCGTASVYGAACCREELHWKPTSRGIWYAMDGRTAVIEFYHPAAHVRQCLLHYGLVDAVREIRRTEKLWT